MVNDNILLTINARIDIALALDFDGVHFPVQGLPLEEVRKKYPHLLLMASCHTVEEVTEKSSADAITLSPIFNPLSKHNDKRVPLTLDGFDRLKKQTQSKCYALGGIEKGSIEKMGQRSIASLGYLCHENAYEHAKILVQR